MADRDPINLNPTDALNERQQRFVDEYVIDLNATHAAIRAGYSQQSAHAQGSALLKHPKVSKAIFAAQAARQSRTRINADWLLRRLADEAEADVADLYDEAGALKPVKDWPLIWRQGLVAGLDVETIRAPDGTEMGMVKKLKVSDRIKRLELIGKHIDVQAFRDRVLNEGGITVTVSRDDADL